MIWGYTEVDGWFYSKQWNYYQRTNGRVVCYIQKQLYGRCILQLYIRGQMGICDLEHRVEDGDPTPLFKLGEAWLEEFEDGNKEVIHKHEYSPHNPIGYWSS
jgi:hypothetical protein